MQVFIYNNNENNENNEDNQKNIIIDFQVLLILSFVFYISTIYFNDNSNIINYI